MLQIDKDKIVELSKMPGRCTLNGYPANITGALRHFPLVRTLEDNKKSHFGMPLFCVEFSWPVVKRVMATGGKFRC